MQLAKRRRPRSPWSEPDAILPRLYQGGIPDEWRLRELGITAVVCVTSERTPRLAADFKRICFPFNDAGLPDLDQLAATVEQAVAWYRAGETVLVHCSQGWNRSGLTMGLILMALGMTGRRAIRLIRRRRPKALFNAQFRRYLERYAVDPTGIVARQCPAFRPFAPIRSERVELP